MTYLEADKKGKYIKRASWPDFVNRNIIVNILEVWMVPPDAVTITREDEKATDWEVKHETV